MKMTKAKLVVVSMCMASLALMDGCTPKQKVVAATIATDTIETIDKMNRIVAACDLGYPPAPGPLFWASQDGCFGASMCSEEARMEVAQWVVDLATWSVEAQDCLNVVRGVPDPE